MWRHLNDKRGSAARSVAHLNGAAMHLDGLLHQGEAETGSSSLAGAIGIEDALRHLRRNTRAVIPNFDPNSAAIVRRGQNLELALAIAGFGGIAQNVAECSAQGVVVTEQYWGRGVELQPRGHAGRERRARELGQQLGEVAGSGRAFGQAAELGELARQLLEPI